MSTIDVLNRLYDGQTSIEETAKMLKLPANEEVVKILDMIKNHRVSAEEGKDLLEAVNTKQPAKGEPQTSGRVKALGIFTLITGILLLFSSVIIVPFFMFFFATSRVHSSPEAMANSMNTGAIFSIAACIILFLFSILFIIYSIGLIRRKNWGRKMGITVSIIALVLLPLYIFSGFLTTKILEGDLQYARTIAELVKTSEDNEIKKQQCHSELLDMQRALELYYSENAKYPDNIIMLTDKGFLVKTNVKDPWGNSYRYSLYENKSNKRGPKLNYLLGSSGPDGIRDTDDDIEPQNEIDIHSFKRVGKRVSIIVPEKLSPLETFQQDNSKGKNILSFYLVDENNLEAAKTGNIPSGKILLHSYNGEAFLVETTPLLAWSKTAGVSSKTANETSTITVTISPEDTKLFKAMTKSSIGKRVAIVINNVVYSSPRMHSEISGNIFQITGMFSQNETKELTQILNSFSKK